MIHSGRGGAGNIRSPSRGPQATIAEEREDALQARLVAEERGRQAHGNFSTGRGGVGNISRSKSRSRSAVRDSDSARTPAPAGDFKSGGRGGWGNIREERHDVDNDSIAEQKVQSCSVNLTSDSRPPRQRDMKPRSEPNTLRKRPPSRESTYPLGS